MTTTSIVCWDIEEEESRKAEGGCGEERGGRGYPFEKVGRGTNFIVERGIECRVANWFKARADVTDVFAVLEQ
jgi:hypothetical protein